MMRAASGAAGSRAVPGPGGRDPGRGPRARAALVGILVGILVGVGLTVGAPATARAQEPGPTVSIPRPTVPDPVTFTVPAPRVGGNDPGSPAAGGDPLVVRFDPGDQLRTPDNALVVLVAVTLLAVAPSLLVMFTAFTRIVVVLGLLRHAIGAGNLPPNQVLVGLSLLLTVFVMQPTLSQVNTDAVQPLLAGDISWSQAAEAASGPVREFMLANTRREELALFTREVDGVRPDGPEDVSMWALTPAFVLSELKTAFMIGFLLFIPFVVIDLVVASILLSLGMMMMPPVLVSLPLKILLFVVVDGWVLVASGLLEGFR